MLNIQVLGRVPGDIAVRMYQKISRKKKEHAVELTYSGIKAKEAAKTYGISTRTIRRAKQRLKEHGNVEGIQQKRGPRPSIGLQLGEVPLRNHSIITVVGNLSPCYGLQR